MSNSAAISKLIKDFSQNPSDSSVALKIGLLYADDGEYESSFDWFSKTYALEPKNSAAYYFSAIVNICMDRYDKAADLWELFMKTEKAPFDFWSSFRIPFAFDFERLKKKSFILCRNRRKLLPFDIPPVYLSALTHLFLGDMETAVGLFEELKDKKGLPKAFPVILSEVYTRSGRRDLALSVLSSFYAENPSFAAAPSRMASIYEDMGEFRKAASLYMEAFRIKQLPAFLVSAAGAFRLAGMEQEAVDCFEGVLYIDESRPEPFIEIAKDAFNKGDILSCWMIMLKAEKINPSLPDPVFWKARALAAWNDHGQAASLYYRAMELGCTEPDVNLLLSESLEMAGEYEEAAYQLLVYVNLHENEDPSLIARADRLLRLAGLDSEADCILISDEKPEVLSEALMKNALNLYRKGDFEGASALLEKAKDSGEPYLGVLCALLEMKGTGALGGGVKLDADAVRGLVGCKSCFNADEREFMMISLLAEKI